MLPAIAPMADEVYKSAGGQDYNGYPIIPAQPQEVQDGSQENQTPAQAEMLSPHENTHPQFPPNPDVGMMAGIDS